MPTTPSGGPRPPAPVGCPWPTRPLTAPVVRPPSFLAIARNYAAHIDELGHERPEFQTWFSKQPTCVVGPGQSIEVPRVSSCVDYEGELGMVIGRRCRHVPADRAFEVVAGFTVVNDVSVRDWQWRTPTMMMGKGFDTHGPTGPWIVTTDEVDDPQDLAVRTWVNGELRQDGDHRRHDLHLCGDDRAPVDRLHPRGGDADHDRYPGRGGRRGGPAPMA